MNLRMLVFSCYSRSITITSGAKRFETKYGRFLLKDSRSLSALYIKVGWHLRLSRLVAWLFRHGRIIISKNSQESTHLFDIVTQVGEGPMAHTWCNTITSYINTVDSCRGTRFFSTVMTHSFQRCTGNIPLMPSKALLQNSVSTHNFR